MQKPWSDAAYWIAHYGLLNLLSYKAQNYQPRADATHNGWALPLSITILKNALHAFLLPNLMGAFIKLILACINLT